ncbi:MAG: YcxB family protein [Myxococcales bacterium]|nr:YcxB family protein [Myxococcales bacterium]
MSGPMEPVALEVDLTEEDVRHGLFFTMVRHSPGLRFLPFFVAFAIAMLGLGVYLAATGRSFSVQEVLFATACVGFLGFVPLSLRRLAARLYRSVPVKKATWRLREQGVQIRSGEALTSLRWEELYRTYETPRAFYVLTKPSVFHVLPKRGLAAAELEGVRAWLARARPRRAVEIVAWLSPSMSLVLMLLVLAIVLSVRG